ncbi:MAG: hypothetical protein HUU17_07210 [Chthonomonadales bacterium]|nr:hypothetical protein [Chthonomonadales bacterium]
MRLLTFLGTTEYKEVPYRLHDQAFRTRLCPVAISRIERIADVVVFVTDEARAMWFGTLEAELAESGATCRAVGIQLPNDEAGMWSLFRAVQGEMTGPNVALDVTHAFRAIPFVAMSVAGFARATNPEAVAAIYYGAYEARDDDGVAPIIELTSLVSVLDWTAAVGAFQRYGDAAIIAKLIGLERRRLASAGRRDDLTALGQVAGDLERASADLLACRPRLVSETARRSREAINRHAETTKERTPAFHAVRNTLLGALGALAVDTGGMSPRIMLEAQLAMVRWYVNHGHPLHALALSREWLVTLVCILRDLDWESRERRDEAERHIHNREVPPDVADRFDRVSQWRNDVLHCGMRASAMSAETVLKNVAKLLAELSPLLALVPEDPTP